MNYHLMTPSPLDLLMKQYELAEMEHAVLLGQDCSVSDGFIAISNEEIRTLVSLRPGFFIGFASVDPRNPNAVRMLEKAFTEENFSGFTFSPARLRMFPNDPRLKKLYELCIAFNKPLIVHAGMSLEKNAVSKYSHPMEFEEILIDFPELKVCLGHFGWPWIRDTAALLIKHENAYANTAMMYTGSPQQLMEQVFHKDLEKYCLDHDICNKVMFGSDSPRIRPVRIKHGLDLLEIKDSTRKKIYYENAALFLGLNRDRSKILEQVLNNEEGE